MANRLQDAVRNRFLGYGTTISTAIDLDADTIKAAFYDAADGSIAASDVWLSTPTGAGWVPATPRTNAPTLGTITIGTLGVGIFDAADTTFTSLTGDTVEYLVVFKDGGSDGASPLIAYWDTFTSGMPLTPNGGNVTVQWNSSGIFGI